MWNRLYKVSMDFGSLLFCFYFPQYFFVVCALDAFVKCVRCECVVTCLHHNFIPKSKLIFYDLIVSHLTRWNSLSSSQSKNERSKRTLAELKWGWKKNATEKYSARIYDRSNMSIELYRWWHRIISAWITFSFNANELAWWVNKKKLKRNCVRPYFWYMFVTRDKFPIQSGRRAFVCVCVRVWLKMSQSKIRNHSEWVIFKMKCSNQIMDLLRLIDSMIIMNHNRHLSFSFDQVCFVRPKWMSNNVFTVVTNHWNLFATSDAWYAANAQITTYRFHCSDNHKKRRE